MTYNSVLDTLGEIAVGQFYEEYRKRYGSESVVNYFELTLIVNELDSQVEEGEFDDVDEEDLEDELIDAAVSMMRSRVGEPFGKVDRSKTTSFYALPWSSPNAMWFGI